MMLFLCFSPRLSRFMGLAVSVILIAVGSSAPITAQESGLILPGTYNAGETYGWPTTQLRSANSVIPKAWQPNQLGYLPVPSETVPIIPTDGRFPEKTSFPQASRSDSQGVGESGAYYGQVLPTGLIYRSYLAGEKESRIRSVWNYEGKDGWIWDITLGGRVGIYRYGTSGDSRPEGFQIDIEGAGSPRLNMEENNDVDAADFRFGLPVTWGTSRYQAKFTYYHLSSHLGDEFLLKNPGFPRLNYSRNEFVLGYSFMLHPELRLYAEAGWAFDSDVAEPWEFQFGVDYSPASCTGDRGAPFVALNAHLREEVNFGGNLVFQAGWAWRRSPSSGMFRAGMQYFNGQSEQFSFFNRSENKIGLGFWYDY